MNNQTDLNGMTLVQKSLYALDGLRYQRRVTALNVVAVSFPVIYAICLGFYAASIHQYQQDILSQSVPTRVIIEPRDILDDRTRLTVSQLNDLERLPSVALAVPRIEVGVHVSVDGSSKMLVPVEGTVPGDPTLDASHLAWGHNVTTRDAREVVVGDSLFRKLGGELTSNGPEPKHVTVQVARTVDDKSQQQRLRLPIAGVLRHSHVDKLYSSIQLADSLDQWCSGHLDNFPESGASGSKMDRRIHDSVVAWAPDGADDSVLRAAERLNLSAEKISPEPFTQISSRSDEIWFRAESATSTDVSTLIETLGRDCGDDIGQYSYKVMERTDSLRIVGLPESDPRWKVLGQKPPPMATLIQTGQNATALRSVDGFPATILSARKEVPCEADFVTTMETLRWLQFDLESTPVVESSVLVRTDDPAQAYSLMQSGVSVATEGNGQAWIALQVATPRAGTRPVATANQRRPAGPTDARGNAPSISGSQDKPSRPLKLASPELLTLELAKLRREFPAALFAEFVGAESTLEWVSSSTKGTKVVMRRRIPVRLVAPETFNRTVVTVLGRLPQRFRNRVNCLYMKSNGGWTPPPSTRLNNVPLHVLGTIPAQHEELWIPSTGIKPVHTGPHGIAIIGPWVDALQAWRKLKSRNWSPVLVQEKFPERFVSLVRKRDDSEAKDSGAIALTGSNHTISTDILAIRLRQPYQQSSRVLAVPVSLQAQNHRVSALAVYQPGVSPRAGHDVTVSRELEGVFVKGRGTILAGDSRHIVVSSTRVDESLPGRMLVVSRQQFREIAFLEDAKSNSSESTGTGDVDYSVSSPLVYRRIQQKLEDRGVTIRPLVRLEERKLQSWRLTRNDETPVDTDVLTSVSRMKPPFFAIIPDSIVEPQVKLRRSAELRVRASDPSDPTSFEQLTLAGHWLNRDRRSEIVLSAQTRDELFPGEKVKDCLGRALPVRVTRNAGQPSAEDLVLLLTVVGVSESSESYVSWKLLDDVFLWTQRRSFYNATRLEFESIREVHERAGYPRGTLYAATLDDVAPLVERLEKSGFSTRHSLAEQQGLRRLAWALSGIIVALVLGSAVTAAANVWSTTALNIHARTWEIGVLKAHGVPAPSIVSIFSIQGGMIALSGFAVGVVCVAVGEPVLREMLHSVFHLPVHNVLSGPVLTPQLAWLYAIVFVAVVVMCQVGVLIPAVRAARLSPVEALRHRA